MFDFGNKFSRMMDLVPGYCFYLDAGFHFQFGNQAFLDLYGKSPAEISGKSALDFFGPECFGGALSDPGNRRPGRRFGFETVFRVGEKSLPVSVDVVSDSDSQGGLAGFFMLAQDLTDRKRAEAAQKTSEARYLLLFNSMEEGVAINEAVEDENGDVTDYIILEANAAFEKHSPYTLKDAQGKRATDLYRMSPEFIRGWWRQHTALSKAVNVEYFHEPSGRWFSVTTTPRDGKRFVTIFTDITKRKEAETALRESALRFDQLAEQSGTVAWETDVRGGYTFVSHVSMTVYGYQPEEMVGRMGLFDLIPESDRESARTGILRMFAGKEPFQDRVKSVIAKDGRQVWISRNGMPLLAADGGLIGYRGSDTDITLRKQMEEALRNSQKLESLGILAGGIAHDFNNLLGGIFGYTDLARALSTEPAVQDYLGQTLGSIDRARALTHQLLTFAKGGVPVLKSESLTPFLQDAASFALSGSPVSARFTIAPDLWACVYDRNRLGQVIDNIVINAMQAMASGGSIGVSAHNRILSKSEIPGLPEGDYVVLSISDQGTGISRDVLPRIFDPFFTTKPKGYGLGLATCYSIVKRHNGRIEAESEPGKGTTFRILLPADRVQPVSTRTAAPREHRGTGRILIMDDETLMRNTLAELLETMGYSVIRTANGVDAVAAFSESASAGKPIVCVFLDLTVPGGMGGKEAAYKIRALNPHTPILVSSGYAEDAVMADPGKHAFSASIQKPFTRAELEAALNLVLDPLSE